MVSRHKLSKNCSLHGKNCEISGTYNFWTSVKSNIHDVWNWNFWTFCTPPPPQWLRPCLKTWFHYNICTRCLDNQWIDTSNVQRKSHARKLRCQKLKKFSTIDLFKHNFEKWSNMLQKSCGGNSTRFLKYF